MRINLNFVERIIAKDQFYFSAAYCSLDPKVLENFGHFIF
jgi:hypothetical protein